MNVLTFEMLDKAMEKLKASKPEPTEVDGKKFWFEYWLSQEVIDAGVESKTIYEVDNHYEWIGCAGVPSGVVHVVRGL